MSILSLDAKRCAHQIIASSRCSACVRACPRRAWRLNDDGLSFDDTACDSCGLCVAACPQDALSLPAPEPFVDRKTPGTLYLACERAQAGTPGAQGIVACLHALSPAWLLNAVQRHKASRIHIACGDCTHCERHPDTLALVRDRHAPRYRNEATLQTLQQRWASVSSRLQALGQHPPVLAELPVARWRTLTKALNPVAVPLRRHFFQRLLELPSAQLHNEAGKSTEARSNLVGGRATLIGKLLEAGQDASERQALQAKGNQPLLRPAPLWQVTLDPERCSWNASCTRLCPQQALHLKDKDDADVAEADRLGHWRKPRVATFMLDMQRCIGCGLCVDACEENALSLTLPAHDAPSLHQEFELTRQPCSACKAPYYQPLENNRGTATRISLCPTCARRGRPRQYNRIVQQ